MGQKLVKKKEATPTPTPTKRPPLTAAQQQQVTNYYKIATDLAIRLASPYSRLIDREEAASIGALALCTAAQRFDPARARSVWPLTQLRIRQKIQEAVHEAMTDASAVVSAPLRLGEDDQHDDPFGGVAAPEVDHADRELLSAVAAWAGSSPARASTINRAASGLPLTPADLAHLEELRAVVGLPSPETVDVASAAVCVGKSPKALRRALARGLVPGVRVGSSWRVFLRAALRVAPAAAA